MLEALFAVVTPLVQLLHFAVQPQQVRAEYGKCIQNKQRMKHGFAPARVLCCPDAAGVRIPLCLSMATKGSNDLNNPVPLNRFHPLIRKPYTPVKQKGAKAMTIAVGLVCNNGVVLAADTEITYGATSKKEESKLFRISHELGCWATYTGVSDFAKEFVDRLRNLEKALSPSGALSLIRSEYNQMLDVQRKRHKDERSYAEFLITIRIPSEKSIYGATAHLYQLRGDHCFSVDSYAAIGAGEEHASSLFQTLHHPFNLTIEAIETAIYAIQKTKRTVQFVDGRTEILDIASDAESDVIDLGKEEIKAIEESYNFLENEFRALIRAFPSPMTEENFDKTIDRLRKNLNSYRTEKNLRKLISS